MSEKNINTINNKYWHKTIWFKEHIPRNAFISWLALRRRLPTKDRLRRWGLNVSGTCVLCNLEIETHRHLFFECFSLAWYGSLLLLKFGFLLLTLCCSLDQSTSRQRRCACYSSHQVLLSVSHLPVVERA